MIEHEFDESQIEALFTHDGQYRFARWGREIVPMVLGTDDQTLDVIKDAFQNEGECPRRASWWSTKLPLPILKCTRHRRSLCAGATLW